MNYKIPGLTSIIFILFALIIADIRLFKISLSLGIIYTIIMPIMFLIVLYFYCTKCPHAVNGTCRHVIFGKLAEFLFGVSDPQKYTKKEIAFTLTALAALVVFPQYWLFQNIILFTIFWIFMLSAVIIIRTGVCPGCRNLNCILCPNASVID